MNSQHDLQDGNHLAVLGYEQSFDRSMSLWANFALGFTYLSPLVGVYSLFAISMATGGPPSIFWIFIVAGGQFLVSLVFGEVVSQYPIHGGILADQQHLAQAVLQRLDPLRQRRRADRQAARGGLETAFFQHRSKGGQLRVYQIHAGPLQFSCTG